MSAPTPLQAQLASRLETVSLLVTALSLILSLTQAAVNPEDPHAVTELLLLLLNFGFFALAVACLAGQAYEEGSDPSLNDPKVSGLVSNDRACSNYALLCDSPTYLTSSAHVG